MIAIPFFSFLNEFILKSFVEKSVSCEIIVDMLQAIPEILPPAYELLENWQKNRDSRMRNTYR